MTITILLVDDHEVLREALREALEREPDFEVVGEAGDVAAALKALDERVPDVVVLDISLGKESGLDVLRRLDETIATSAIVFSMHTDADTVGEALHAGAAGYVGKTASKTELLKGIRAVAGKHRYFCRETSVALANQITGTPSDEIVLSARQREVLRLLAEGKRSAMIAGDLNISPATVEVHRRNIMRKLDLHSAAELTRYAIRHGISKL